LTLARGRILRAPSGTTPVAIARDPAAAAIGRRMARLEVEARERADAVVEAATRRAVAILEDAERRAQELKAAAFERGRAEALAETAALALALRNREAEADDRAQDRLIAIASLLAERLLGHALATRPEEVLSLAAQALSEAGGARRVELHAHPEDAALLRSGIAAAGFDPAGRVHAVVSDESLARGDLRLNTELGMIDARLGPELSRLAERLREALSS
jgi:flagellar biosynthesis/type III secretory pathway protein FliH